MACRGSGVQVPSAPLMKNNGDKSALTNLAIPKGWHENNIADQSGKRFLITGGTSGLGLVTARELIRKGADVTITARSMKKADKTLKLIGPAKVIEMDLTDLASVRSAATEVNAEKSKYDVVILNAGVMATPFTSTKDGFELQMGTNHLGHFAFAGLIKNQISDRLISMSSQAHRMGAFGSGSISDVRDRCCGVGKYSPWAAYGASKLANLLFTAEVERRRIENKWSFIPLAAHPGWASTNLFSVGPEMAGKKLQSQASAFFNSIFAQSALRGALPMLCAATFPNLVGSSYLGPDGPGEMRGTPKLTRARALAYDQTLAANLWAVSEELTGVTWEDSPHA